MAVAAAYTFLAINGARIVAGADETYGFIDGLFQTGSFSFEKLVPWLRIHVRLDGTA